MITIYKASAGSGKTFTLAREYIKLILGRKGEDGRYRLRRPGSQPLHSSVLAITFTNKATEEMKGRIIHELAVIAGAEKGWTQRSPYEKDLCKTFGCTPEQLAEVAGEALKELLYDFNRFNVSTIDSFFQMVLRSFAHEAEVSGSYEVELDDQSVISMSIDNLLQDLNHVRQTPESRRLVEWLTRFMTKLIEDGKGFNIFNRASQVHEDLIKFIADISDDTYRDNEKRILAYLGDPTKFDDFRKAIEGRTKAICDNIAAACRTAIVTMKRCDKKDGKCTGIVSKVVADAIYNWGATGYYNTQDLSATLRKAINDVDNAYVTAGKKSPRRQELDPVLYDALNAIGQGFEDINMLRLIASNIYQLGLLARVTDYLNRYRLENSTILLSDTNALLAKVIGGEDSPFLYEKVGVRFNHYLIDEFQDTSWSQWQNLSPLIAESLSEDHDNLVIGDEKQCIYRFRGSDPSLLHNLHHNQPEGRSEVRGESIDENTNWRSSGPVIRFNNTLFSALASSQGFGDIYSGVAQQISPKHLDDPGYVRLRVFESERGDTEADELALQELTVNLRRQLESGYRPGDIAILVRTWKEGESVIAHLEKVKADDGSFPQFNIVSDRSLLISRSAAVMLIVSRLRYLSSIEFTPRHHKKSRREIARVLNDFEDIFARSGSASDALLEAISRMEARNGTDGIQSPQPSGAPDEAIAGLDLVSLVETIISTVVPTANRENEGVFITAFQDMVSDFVAKGKADIRSFLQWWDERGQSMSVAGADDPTALNILTIHKSKGLEFHCVHVPFAGFIPNSRAIDRAWFELPEIEGIPLDIMPPMMPLNITRAMTLTPLCEQYVELQRQKQLDFINLLYVALTRAVDELIVGVKVIRSKNSKGDTIPSLAEVITDSIAACTPQYCASLEAAHGITPGKDSPYAPLSLDAEGVLELGAPTQRREEESERRSAIDPVEGERISGYQTGATTSPWTRTRISDEHPGRMAVARERGIILHDLMARIATPDDIGKAFDMAAASEEWRELSADEIAELRAIVERRVNDPQVAGWFNGFRRLLLEREVMTDSGDIKRFDRVVWTADGEIHLIDYKSGSQPVNRYRKQIRGYLAFFKSIGYLGVRAFLYYLDSGKIIEIES